MLLLGIPPEISDSRDDDMNKSMNSKVDDVCSKDNQMML